MTPGGPLRSEDLYRLIADEASFTRSDAGEGAGAPLGVLAGHFAVFNEWTRIDSPIEGRFYERFAPGAFAKTIRENRDRMKVLFRHGLDPQIGEKPLGPILLLEEDEVGVAYEVQLLDTAYNRELLPGLAAGLYGASFRFAAVKQNVVSRPRKSDHNPEGWPERTISEAFVREFGPCTFGAYGGATAGLRSVTDDVTAARLAALELRGQTKAMPAIESRLIDPEEEARNDRMYERVVSQLGSSLWAIEPNALGTILGIVAERAAGRRASEDEIRERIGTAAAQQEPDAPPGSPVRVIPLRGPIVPRAGLLVRTSGVSSVEELQAEIRDAVDDPTVKAVLLDIDSPGGNAALIPELGAQLLAARDLKPVWAIANTLAASAAYWIAACCTTVVATPSAEVGSIGIYSAHNDLSGAQAKAGVKTSLVSAGPYKVERSPFAPLSDEAKAAMQERVDELYSTFVQAVADGRVTTVDDVAANYGQGRTLTAQKAFAAGMVDRVATLAETLAQLEQFAEGGDNELSEDGEAEPEPAPDAAPQPTDAALQMKPSAYRRAPWYLPVAEGRSPRRHEYPRSHAVALQPGLHRRTVRLGEAAMREIRAEIARQEKRLLDGYEAGLGLFGAPPLAGAELVVASARPNGRSDERQRHRPDYHAMDALEASYALEHAEGLQTGLADVRLGDLHTHPTPGADWARPSPVDLETWLNELDLLGKLSAQRLRSALPPELYLGVIAAQGPEPLGWTRPYFRAWLVFRDRDGKACYQEARVVVPA